jgi:hypothetical protein
MRRRAPRPGYDDPRTADPRTAPDAGVRMLERAFLSDDKRNRCGEMASPKA